MIRLHQTAMIATLISTLTSLSCTGGGGKTKISPRSQNAAGLSSLSSDFEVPADHVAAINDVKTTVGSLSARLICYLVSSNEPLAAEKVPNVEPEISETASGETRMTMVFMPTVNLERPAYSCFAKIFVEVDAVSAQQLDLKYTFTEQTSTTRTLYASTSSEVTGGTLAVKFLKAYREKSNVGAQSESTRNSTSGPGNGAQNTTIPGSGSSAAATNTFTLKVVAAGTASVSIAIANLECGAYKNLIIGARLVPPSPGSVEWVLDQVRSDINPIGCRVVATSTGLPSKTYITSNITLTSTNANPHQYSSQSVYQLVEQLDGRVSDSASVKIDVEIIENCPADVAIGTQGASCPDGVSTPNQAIDALGQMVDSNGTGGSATLSLECVETDDELNANSDQAVTFVFDKSKSSLSMTSQGGSTNLEGEYQINSGEFVGSASGIKEHYQFVLKKDTAEAGIIRVFFAGEFEVDQPILIVNYYANGVLNSETPQTFVRKPE